MQRLTIITYLPLSQLPADGVVLIPHGTTYNEFLDAIAPDLDPWLREGIGFSTGNHLDRSKLYEHFHHTIPPDIDRLYIHSHIMQGIGPKGCSYTRLTPTGSIPHPRNRPGCTPSSL